MDLTVRRVVQIKEAIQQREEVRSWENMKVVEWQTKSLGTITANTAETSEAREQLIKIVNDMSITGQTSNKGPEPKTPKTYRTKTGEVIQANEIDQYTYDEIDHTEEDKLRIENTRKKNTGINLHAAFTPR